MIGAGEGYSSADPIPPVLYAPGAPVTAQVVSSLLRGGYVVGHRHGTCLARTVRGIPQVGTEDLLTLEPTSFTEIAGARWRVYVPAETVALVVVMLEVYSAPADTVEVERRVRVSDGVSVDTGAAPQVVDSATNRGLDVADPWPGQRWYSARRQTSHRVTLDNVAPGARLDVYVEGRQTSTYANQSSLMLSAALFWSAT